MGRTGGQSKSMYVSQRGARDVKTVFNLILHYEKRKQCIYTLPETEGPKPVIVMFLHFQDRDPVYSKVRLHLFRDKRNRILAD